MPEGTSNLEQTTPGQWELEIHTNTGLCTVPPPGSARLYSIALPQTLADSAGHMVLMRLIDDANDIEREFSVQIPTRIAIPPAIAGTWFAPEFPDQGLLLNMLPSGALAVSWNTYDAEGNLGWFSGVGPTDPSEPTTLVELTAIASGHFAAPTTPPTPVTDWALLALENLRCGELLVGWLPHPDTGLEQGTMFLKQLTSSYSDNCDIAAYAAARVLTLEEIVPENVD